MFECSLEHARVGAPFVLEGPHVVGLWESFFHVLWARDRPPASRSSCSGLGAESPSPSSPGLRT
eukprot:7821277-Alexandrium_andersonii.AAC.1